MIKGLHHNAYRCRNSEETAVSMRIFSVFRSPMHLKSTTKTDARFERCILFIAWRMGHFWALFLSPGLVVRIQGQHDFDCTSRLRSTPRHCTRCSTKARRGDRDSRISDHQFINSIYFRDPNGYVIELTAKKSDHDDAGGTKTKRAPTQSLDGIINS
ncbi:MAG: hypothetical protein CM1200mP41_09390 [Gammaproteobacteria bacterium]|nr:MAG: hypothetical protein CM1200mP41_09390 [Gammaproteobacteria bacterium]